jgi:hypothetical protein
MPRKRLHLLFKMNVFFVLHSNVRLFDERFSSLFFSRNSVNSKQTPTHSAILRVPPPRLLKALCRVLSTKTLLTKGSKTPMHGGHGKSTLFSERRSTKCVQSQRSQTLHAFAQRVSGVTQKSPCTTQESEQRKI